jgi:hypothetical protein
MKISWPKRRAVAEYGGRALKWRKWVTPELFDQ